MKWSALAEKVHQSLIRNSLLKEKSKILLAVSGGMDSVVMFHIFLELSKAWKWELFIGHIDHGLRPDQDEKESRLCRSLARDHQLEYFEEKLNLEDPELKLAYSKYSSQTPSVESLARYGRYNILSNWAKELNCDTVCIAHHASDQAETVLYRLLTGSGVKGLSGIPVSRDIFKRPLLNVFKKDILTYAQNKKIKYYDDKSNMDTSYARNNIRHHVIPSLIQMGFDNCEKALFDSAKSIDQANAALNYYIERDKNELITRSHGSVALDLNGFSDLPAFGQKEILKQIYRNNLKIKQHISDAQTEQILSFIERSDTGTVFELYGVKAFKERHKIRWKQNEKTSADKRFICREDEINFKSGVLRIEKILNQNDHTKFDKLTAVFSLDLLGKELYLRSWENGDKVRIFGTGGQKNVSDVLKDEKVQPSEKHDIPILECEGNIIWIPGVKRSSLFIVNKADKALIKITYKMEQEYDQKNLNTRV